MTEGNRVVQKGSNCSLHKVGSEQEHSTDSDNIDYGSMPFIKC